MGLHDGRNARDVEDLRGGLVSKFSERWKEIEWSPLPSWGKRTPPRQVAPATFFMPDVTPFISPIDRSEITSRSQLREHERRHGVRQCGELKTAQDFAPSPNHTRNERKLDEALGRAIDRLGLSD